ncbi:MAG: hypothetical protein E3J81_08455 [Dehalococcoidia bacterium]|nr:MAG: hypothetical protein E3J81_08455 [Dehalococcoidia bacterium]
MVEREEKQKGRRAKPAGQAKGTADSPWPALLARRKKKATCWAWLTKLAALKREQPDDRPAPEWAKKVGA